MSGITQYKWNGASKYRCTKCEKLLGIKINCKLSFDNYIGNICKNAGAKLKIHWPE